MGDLVETTGHLERCVDRTDHRPATRLLGERLAAAVAGRVRLTLLLDGEILVDEPYAHGTFSHRRRDAFDRVTSHITDGEHTGKR